MILSDRDIIWHLENNDRMNINELTDFDEQIQPASVDLRLGSEFAMTHSEDDVWEETDSVTLEPGEHYLGHTQEEVEVPPRLCGFLTGRSSLGRLGVSVHTTAGLIDPGFAGDIVLEIYNHSKEPVTIDVGERVCQLYYLQLSSRPIRAYDEREGTHYMNQKGAVQSRL